jgi:hypothetical protein
MVNSFVKVLGTTMVVVAVVAAAAKNMLAVVMLTMTMVIVMMMVQMMTITMVMVAAAAVAELVLETLVIRLWLCDDSAPATQLYEPPTLSFDTCRSGSGPSDRQGSIAPSTDQDLVVHGRQSETGEWAWGTCCERTNPRACGESECHLSIKQDRRIRSRHGVTAMHRKDGMHTVDIARWKNAFTSIQGTSRTLSCTLSQSSRTERQRPGLQTGLRQAAPQHEYVR